jgi:hypothetical protein
LLQHVPTLLLLLLLPWRSLRICSSVDDSQVICQTVALPRLLLGLLRLRLLRLRLI